MGRLSTTECTYLPTFAVVLVFARGLAQRRGAKKCFLWFSKTGFGKD